MSAGREQALAGALRELVGWGGRGSVADGALLAVAVVVLLLVFSRIGQALGLSRAGAAAWVGAVAVGLVTLVVAWVVIGRGVVPQLDRPVPPNVLRAAAAVLSLPLAVPLMCRVLRTRFHNVLVAWAAGLTVAVLVTWLGRGAMDMVAAGSTKAGQTRARTAEMQDFLNRQ